MKITDVETILLCYRYEQDEQNKRFRFKTHKENAFLLDESERNFAMPSANDKKIGF